MKLPTAEDGEIVYKLDTRTREPLPTKDDRAEALPVTITFLPRKGNGLPQWAFLYQLRFAPGARPTAIRIETENQKPLALEVEDAKPVLQSGGSWSGKTQPIDFNKAWADRITGPDPWVLQRRYTITYADGRKSVLHQLAFIRTEARNRVVQQFITGVAGAQR